MKTLVKSKIVLTDDKKSVMLLMWKKTFWFFGYWYYSGTTQCSAGIDQKHIDNINDVNVGNVLYDNFITGRKWKKQTKKF